MPCNPHVYGLYNFTSVAIRPHLDCSLFDTRSFPIDCLIPSSAVFQFDFNTASWEYIASMPTPHGSFTCAKVPNSYQIIVAGGSSHHTMFSAAGSRMTLVEKYDICRDEWVAMEGLPSFRAGCVGFFAGDVEEREFWVRGGYGQARTISEVVSMDKYYRNAVVMELTNRNSAGRWRETEPGVFMLDGNDIFR